MEAFVTLAGGDAGARPRRDDVERHARRRPAGGPGPRRPAGRHRRAVPVRPTSLHRQQGPQRPPADEVEGEGLQAQRVRLGRAERAGRVARPRPTFFAALGLDYIPPELREDTGEIEAAARHKLPRLVEVKDIRGVFHNHTTASDGGATLEEMAEAAQALGLPVPRHRRPFAIADRRQRPDAGARPRSSRRRSIGSTRRSRASASSRGPSATSWPTARSTSTTSCWRRSTTSWPASIRFSTVAGGDDGPHRQGGPASAGDDARPRDRPAAAAARRLPGRPRSRAASRGRGRAR